MEELFLKIQEYKDDSDYHQILMTIFETIDPDDFLSFYNMIVEAEGTNKKIYVDLDSLKGVMWSDLDFKENVKMK